MKGPSRAWSAIGYTVSSLDAEDVRGFYAGVELDVILLTLPHVSGARYEVDDREGPARLYPELADGDRHRRLLRVEWVEVDRHEDDVRPVRGPLAVEEDLVVVARQQGQVARDLKGGVAPPDRVEPPDVVLDVP